MEQLSVDSPAEILCEALQEKIDGKTKPLGALGVLEKLALKIGQIQNSLTPRLNNPHIVVFAGDHGIVTEGVSAYPQDVTYQMVMNFVNGGAAINVFCRQNQIQLKVVDSGVNFDFDPRTDIIHAKISKGTRSFLSEKAMTRQQCEQAIKKGADIVSSIAREECNVIGFGDMGIGNTSAASILMSQICQIPIADCIGRGSGLDDEQLNKKIIVCRQAIANHNKGYDDPVDLLATFGGFEIAMICGAILQAAQHKMVVLVDGFISSAAYLVAYSINQNIKEYAVFCHQSDEAGHAKMLEFLDVQPVLKLNMRLGEGTGAAIAYPLLQSAVHFLNEMASFESAGVSGKE